MQQNTAPWHQYSGVIHVHSTYSDGAKSIPQIAAIAGEVGVDFMLVTDHNTLQGQTDGLEGWYGNLLVGVGCEINDADDKNHYLAFNIRQPLTFPLPAEEYVCQVRRQGGFGFIAHPNEKRASMPEYPPYPWTLWNSDCFDGIEIWNQMSEWMEGLTHKNKYLRALHPRRSIVAPKKETLERWDALNQKRKVPAIGGVDAHGHVHKLWGFIPKKIFHYKVSFRTIRTYILAATELKPGSDVSAALQVVYEALREGRSYIAHEYSGSAAGFYFWAENENSRADMGGMLTLTKATALQVILPAEAEVALIRNGQKTTVKRGRRLEFPLELKGVFRVEVYRNGRLWILSNHIRIQ